MTVLACFVTQMLSSKGFDRFSDLKKVVGNPMAFGLPTHYFSSDTSNFCVGSFLLLDYLACHFLCQSNFHYFCFCHWFLYSFLLSISKYISWLFSQHCYFQYTSAFLSLVTSKSQFFSQNCLGLLILAFSPQYYLNCLYFKIPNILYSNSLLQLNSLIG